MNENFRLKANNIQFFLRLMQSDMGVRLCFMFNAIRPADNGIGFTNWVKNFSGNIISKELGHGAIGALNELGHGAIGAGSQRHWLHKLGQELFR